MNSENKAEKFQEQSWFIIINQQSRGPLSLRDLDVMMRTNEINSFTYAWKNGMKEWRLMNDIQEVRQSIFQSSKEIFEIKSKREELHEVDKKGNADNKIKEGEVVPESEQQKTIQNKDENVLTILEATVDNLLQKSFQQTEDGKWSIFDEGKGDWVQETEKPIEKMEVMKNNLMNKLKAEFFTEEKTNFKRRGAKEKEKAEERELTKEELAKKEKNKKKAKKQAEKKKEKWYQAKVNTFVYISGLPLDVAEAEVKEFCAKAGVVRIDMNTGKQKIKIYKDESGMPKGDAAISYAREESVEIALEMLNESEIRSGFKVTVEKAQFHQKDESYLPRESKKESKVQKMLAKKRERKLLGWDEDNEDNEDGLRIIVIKNVFTPEEGDNDELVEAIKKQITAAINQVAEVQRVRFYENHPEGVVEIKFKKQNDAEACVQAMNRRTFRGRQLQSDYWDGQTDFKYNAVSLVLQNQRLNKFATDVEENQHTQKNGEEKVNKKAIN